MRRFNMLVFALLLVSVSACETYKSAGLEATAFKKMIDKSPDLQLIDVRTGDEYASGHLAQSVNIDFFGEDFQERLKSLDKNAPIAVYCTVGQRSGKAFDMLVEMKFKEVYHLEGGTASWQNEGYPLQ